ncbi:MAG: ribonuclease G [Gammaproteobacteria bacterium]|nr:ribonuclease G [Gammaproteobacteria bacterium]
MTSKEILINVTPRETRVAILENGVLQEIYVERTSRLGLVGNIYNGKVSRVLPGMQAAFIDIGLERTAFLHASDIIPAEQASEDKTKDETYQKTDIPPITELLKEGQTILTQVIKDPLGTKGARLTTEISIPARFLVFMPRLHHIGISQKIEDEPERARLINAVEEIAIEFTSGGYIVRTAAEGIDEETLKADALFLQKLWISIQERSKSAPATTLIHEDLHLVMRMMRDLTGSELEKIRIDSRETLQRIFRFANKFIPEVAPRIEHYPGERPIFDLYGVEDEIQKALERKVKLKSGGYLIIDQTEAMTTIDVNTGGFVGHRNLEETIFKTNLEATQAIVRQLRLRNLGGMIIIDFIDMSDQDHRDQVLRTLEKNLERDNAKNNISEVSSLGLVQMTRKRTRESLEHILCETCHTCSGRGTVKTAETLCYEIFREILREARQFEANKLLLLASQKVIDLMLDEESANLAELEAFIGTPVKLQVETQYSQEQYDIILM